MAIISIIPEHYSQTAIFSYLEWCDYLRNKPCSSITFESAAEQHNIEPEKAYRLYKNSIGTSIRMMKPNEIDFIQQVISLGYVEHTGFKAIIKLTDECPHDKQMGNNIVYVFPNSGSKTPVIEL